MEKEPFRPGLSRNETLTSLLREYQEDPRSRVFAKLADEYRKQGLVGQAIEIIEEGLEFHPGFSPGLLVMAHCFFDKKRYADSLKVVNKLLTQNPQNFRAERLRADIYLRLGQSSAAIDSLNRIVEMAPRDREAVKLLEELENKEDASAPQIYTNAPASSDTAIDWPAGAQGEISEFQVSDIGNLWEETLQEIAVASERIPDEEASEESASAYSALADPEFATRTVAELYLRQGLKEKAKQVLETILKRDPDNEWAKTRLREDFQSNKSGGTPIERQKLMVQAQVLERMLLNLDHYRRSRPAV